MSLGDVCTMSDREVEDAFSRLRWSQNNGQPYCPHCGSVKVCTARRKTGALRYRCQGCHKDFSITSGTIFAWHKLSLRIYLLAILIVCNEVKGKSMLALRRDLRVQYKTAFVLSHEIRAVACGGAYTFGGGADRLRSQLRQDRPQGLDARRERVTIVSGDVGKVFDQSGGFFVG